MNSDLCSLHAAWVFCCSHWELLSQYLLCSSFQNKSLVLLVETRPLVCLAAGRFCWMFQFKSGFPFHWLLKTRQEEGNQTAEQTSFASKNLRERSHPGQTLRKSLLTVLKFYHRSPGKQELLQSFASVKSRVESRSCLFPSRDAKVKSEETVSVGLEDGSRFAALALVSSHRARSVKHRFTGWFRLEKTSTAFKSNVNSALPSPPLGHVPKRHIYTSFKPLQGRWFHHWPGQPVPAPDNPFGEESFPNSQAKPPLPELEAVSYSCCEGWVRQGEQGALGFK